MHPNNILTLLCSCEVCLCVYVHMPTPEAISTFSCVLNIWSLCLCNLLGVNKHGPIFVKVYKVLWGFLINLLRYTYAK